MFPTDFRVLNSSRAADILIGLYHHSMSLRNAVRRGYMPPLEVLNLFTACGYDDVDEDIAYMPVDRFEPATIQWEPFTLTEAEYERLLTHIKQLYPDVRVKSFGAASYTEWFTACYGV